MHYYLRSFAGMFLTVEFFLCLLSVRVYRFICLTLSSFTLHLLSLLAGTHRSNRSRIELIFLSIFLRYICNCEASLVLYQSLKMFCLHTYSSSAVNVV